MALYRAKQEGRGSTRFFEPAMDALVQDRARIERALREAIRRNEIGLAFQPLYSLAGERLLGFEALARWTDHLLGEIPPATFIQVAEDTGLITHLSDILFEKACREAVTWPADLTLSFNISPLQLRDTTLGLRIMKALARAGLSPERLIIEITESAIVKDFDAARRILNDLHEAGIRVALDDFGNGYSSLAQPSHFHFDKLKIDKSFVGRALDQEDQATLVRAIPSIGRGLGLETTAEGVETEEQLAFLQKEGCDVGQGYLFSRQLAPERARALAHGEEPGSATASNAVAV
jgi:predicted signal transduction protein with EAL and GGDEF domain